MMKLARLLVLLLLLTVGMTGLAAANGAPITIFLSYLPELSTTGPEDARGEAVVSIGEATLSLEATGLPRRQGEQYEAWLQVDSSQGALRSLGTFNADANGQVAYEAEYDSIPEDDYRYFRISIEPDPDNDPAPSGQWSIAGVFPNPDIQPLATTPASSTRTAAGEGATATPVAPESLPVTGGGAAPWGIALLGITVLLAVWVGFRLREMRSTR